MLGCNSTQQEHDPGPNYENLVPLEPPQSNLDLEDSQIYVDSAQKIHHRGQTAILIRGSFPDGCTRLKSAGHQVENDTLKVTIEAWRDPEMMCAQVLTSFSFIYSDIAEAVLGEHEQISVNNKLYNLQ
jgi:hypothetical protein